MPIMERCSGFRPKILDSGKESLREIDGKCIHGFFVTPACFMTSSRAPICCNEDWLERTWESLLDDSGKPKFANPEFLEG
jgi:hypothetical protein